MACGGLNIDRHYDYRRETRKVKRSIIMYIKDGKNPAGSDYTIITELKTLKGIKRRYHEHNRRIIIKGCEGYIVVPYFTWWSTHDVNTLINNCVLYKLEG